MREESKDQWMRGSGDNRFTYSLQTIVRIEI